MPIKTVDTGLEPVMTEIFLGHFESPIGLIAVGATSEAVTSLHFVEQHRRGPASNQIADEVIAQISEYFLGTRRGFDLPVVLKGTAFQRLVWQQLLSVPFGKTASYQQIAHAIGKPGAVRAVGGACGRNPISIIVPCHRVVGSDGNLTGYGAGLWRKKWLLTHEGSLLS